MGWRETLARSLEWKALEVKELKKLPLISMAKMAIITPHLDSGHICHIGHSLAALNFSHTTS
jgi:hypothetical protein